MRDVRARRAIVGRCAWIATRHIRLVRAIFGVATALGFFSGFQAFYFVSTFTDWPASSAVPARAQSWLLVFVGVPHAGDPVALAPLPARARSTGSARCPCTSPASSSPRSLHIALTRRALLIGDRSGCDRRQRSGDSWLHEAQQHVLQQFRLGDDDLLGHRRPQPRAAAICSEARDARAARQPARDPPGRSAAAGAAAAAAAALPVQHAQHDLGADAPRRRRRRQHDRAAERSAAHLAAEASACRKCRSRRSSISSPSTWRSNKPASAIV